MMLRVLLYGYCRGVASSRKIEQATYEDVAFRFLSADTHPDHDTIAAFRKCHLEALAGRFVQVFAEGDSRTGLWPDQGAARIPSV